MKNIKVGINGFGRIGRCIARIVSTRDNITLAAINSRSDARSHEYLLKYDSVHGWFDAEVSSKTNTLIIDSKEIVCFSENSPESIPWDKNNVDIVIEATGKFTSHADSSKHLKNGPSHVVISAPSKDADKTIVMGVNENELYPEKHKVISNASCTTNCLATVVKVLDDAFEIKRGLMTTCHSVTLAQTTLDRSAKNDKRRGRAGYSNIIPTSTGASKALSLVLPHLKGKIKAHSLRVPVANGSLIDLNVEVEKKVDEESVNQVFQRAAESKLKGILSVSKGGLVSSDIIGMPYSSIIDMPFTTVVDGNLIKVFAWYDNEWGYATRVVDLVEYIHEA